MARAVQDGPAYAAVFLAVLRSVSNDETTKYVLALLDEALIGAPRLPPRLSLLLSCRLSAAVERERIKLFHGANISKHGPGVILLRLLERNDWCASLPLPSALRC